MEITSQNEQTLQERIEEYRNLEKFHRKKLQRTKEEGKFHFDKLKLKVQEMKQKQVASKQQHEAQLAAKDQNYLAIIKDLQDRLRIVDKTYVTQSYEYLASSHAATSPQIPSQVAPKLDI